MDSECVRIADQLTRAFSGDAWHGPPLRDLLSDVTAQTAAARPINGVHSIWELAVHIDVYTRAGTEAIRGTPIPRWYGTGQDWLPLTDTSEHAWSQTSDDLFGHAQTLAAAIRDLPDRRLLEIVPGRDYNFYHLFHGLVQHSLYHGGQIAILKKVAAV